jgi:N-acetylglucosaminyldiphosphoundecaprenol N-acetyl-beta-D-mannosaminyltransferase
MSAGPRTELLGVPIDALGMREIVDEIRARIETDRPGAHLGVNAANLIMARDRPAYLETLSSADLISPDGQWVVWGSRLLGAGLPERVTGIDLMEELLATARANDWGVYLLGARPEIVERLARILGRHGVRVVGFRDGYFSASDSVGVADAVRASGAALLFVGMPSPQKEQFIIEHARSSGVPFSIGVGGSFDVLTGRIRRAPRLLQRLGLEWLVRFVQEPSRFVGWHGRANSRFLLLLVREVIGRRRGASR